MDTERWRVTAEAVGIRLRTRLRLLAQVAGIAVLVLGAWNLLAYPYVGETLWLGYRAWLPMVTATDGALVVVADVVVMAVGAVVTWLA